MADTGGEQNPPKKIDSREEKLRLVREKQAEERQRRLEELKKHALEAQQLREQKELERRKRMEDLRQKENERRSQVEERKRQIWEAEKERREAILRKNQEREARIETKRKNERSSIVFAFGSSTPRMLETSDSNCFWGPRRATSTANLRLFPTTTPTVPLSRRPSERELEPKKRASSAGGLYRNPGAGESEDSSPANTSHLRIGRRKTDLMPTIPSPRESTNSRPASGTRSLARTPGDTTPSRPGSVLSQCSLSSASTPTPAPRLRSAPRRPRPFSIHVTGVSKDKEIQKINSPSEEKPKLKEVKEIKVVRQQPVVKQSVIKKQNQQKNEEISKLQSKKIENNKNVVENNNIVEMNNKVNSDSVKEETKVVVEGGEKENKEVEKRESEEPKKVETVPETEKPSEKVGQDVPTGNKESQQAPVQAPVQAPAQAPVQGKTEQSEKKEVSPTAESENGSVEDESGKGNVMSRSKITTEEEAKAALAERRRLAREQAEREAEAERLRLEMEAQKEAERIRKEEEEQRLAEEEQLRLLEEARRLEEFRLMQAIQEAQKREMEEKERRQQEELARLEKEESERKAREEAERQRIEMAERLKREEEERQARRKRVEAIMKRTRNNPASSTNKADSEKGEEDGTEHEKDEPKGKVEVFLHGERVSADRSLTNGQPSQDNHKETLDNMIENNHSNGVEITKSNIDQEDCLNSNSTLATPLIAFQGKTKDTPVAANYMA